MTSISIGTLLPIATTNFGWWGNRAHYRAHYGPWRTLGEGENNEF